MGFRLQGDYGDSFLKLAADPSTSPNNQNLNGWGLKVVDYFTPHNELSLSNQDLDLGSGGVLLLPDQSGPDPHELVGAGKQGTIYVINRDNMGKFNPNTDDVVQEIASALPSGSYGTPAYFNGQLYYGGAGDFLKAFQVSNGLLSNSPTSESSNAYHDYGTTPSISANGTATGVVWGMDANFTSSNSPVVLYAYDATNLANELYNSSQVANRDQAGLAIKWVPPTVANGKVFVATADELDVYGLLPTSSTDSGFEQVVVGAGKYQYDPTGSPWTFNGDAGHLRQQQRLHLGQPTRTRGGLRSPSSKTPARSPSLSPTGRPAPTCSALMPPSGAISERPSRTLKCSSTALSWTLSPPRVRLTRATPPPHSQSPPGLIRSVPRIEQCRRRQHGLHRPGRRRTCQSRSIADPGFEKVVGGAGQFQYDPTGSPWTFAGSAGISGNNSNFTFGNPPAPQGVSGRLHPRNRFVHPDCRRLGRRLLRA